MKRVLEVCGLIIIYLLIIMVVFFVIDYKKVIVPIDYSVDYRIKLSDYSYEINDMSETDTGYVVTGIDPYIIFKGINSYIKSIDVSFTEQNDSSIVIYYDTGYGFDAGEMMQLVKKNDSDYSGNVGKNLNAVRVDIEGLQTDTMISEINVVLDSTPKDYRKYKSVFFAFNIMLVLIVMITTAINVIIKRLSFTVCLLPIIISSIVVGLSECILFRLSGGVIVVTFFFDVFVILAALSAAENKDSPDTNIVSEEKQLDV